MSNDFAHVDIGGQPGSASAAAPSFAADADPVVDDGLATREAERYERRQVLGIGGMGRVVVAHDRRLDRDVALKEVRADRPELEARLAREAKVTARLEHPGIVAVYDAGHDADGTPFYTMRVVRGRSLHDALREVSGKARLRFVRHVLDAANAVAWAHRHGVVHRDLKPANIMVGEFGETQVVDWGLAHVVGESGPAASPSGGRWPVVGTPAYMSPEQTAGCEADARSDVWSLGAVLRDVAGAALSAELGAVIERAMAEAPTDRYADAKALADDLEAWLEGRRVAAYSYSSFELLKRLWRAWRLPLTIVGLALVAVSVAIALGYAETAAERDRAEAAEATTRGALERADRDLALALLGAAGERLQSAARPEAELLAAASLTKAESPEARGMLALLAGEAAPIRVRVVPLPKCLQLKVSSDGARAICVDGGVMSVLDLTNQMTSWGAPAGNQHAFLEDEGLVVVDQIDGVAVLHDAADGARVGEMQVCCGALHTTPSGSAMYRQGLGHFAAWTQSTSHAESRAMACSDRVVTWDDLQPLRYVALCSDGRFATARGEARVALSAMPEPSDVVMAGDHIVIGTTEGEIVVVDAAGAVVARASGGVGLVSGLSLSEDGTLIAVDDEEPGPRLFDLVAGTYRMRLPAANGAAFVSGGARRLVTWDDAVAVTWDLPHGAPGSVTMPDGVTSLELDGLGRMAVATAVGVAVLADDGRLLRWTASPVVSKAAAFSADGERVAIGLAADPSALQVHATMSGTELARGPLRAGMVRRVARLADDHWLVGRAHGGLEIYDRHARLVRADTVERATFDLALSSDRATAYLLADRTRDLLRVDVATFTSEALGRGEWQAIAVHGEDVACAGRDVSIVDRGGQIRMVLEAPGARLEKVAWAADGAWIAAGALDGTVYLWRPDRARAVASVRAHRERVGALVFDPLGRFLVSGGWDDRVRRLDLGVLSAQAADLLANSEHLWGRSWGAIVSGAGRGH